MNREIPEITNGFYPLSLSQMNIWNLEQAFCGTPINNISTTVNINGTFDINTLQKTLNHVIQTDISLRVRLFLKDKVPVQYYADFNYEQFDVLDFTLTNDDGIGHWETTLSSEVFQLYDSPLYYFAIFKNGENSGGLVLKTHHLISDGCSQINLINRISSVYLDLLEGRELSFEEMPSYKLHIEKEIEYLSSSSYMKDKDYWNKRLTSLADPSIIKEYMGAVLSPIGRRKSFKLSGMLNHAIQDFCIKNRVAPFTIFYMAFALYLKKIGGCECFGIGVPTLNRMDFIDKKTTGMFVSTLPFINEFSEEWSLIQFNDRLSEQWYELLKHQRFPFIHINNALKEMYPETKNLFHLVLSFQSIKIKETRNNSVSFSGKWHYCGYQAENLCIHLTSEDENSNFSVDYDYLTQLFSEEEIEDIHTYITNILTHALSDWNMPLHQVSMIPEREVDKVLFDFNNTYKTIHSESFYKDFYENAMKYPNKAAFIHKRIKITNKELLEKVNWYAVRINNMLSGQNHVIAVLLPKSFELIEGMIAISQSGNTWVLISPENPTGRIKELLQDSGAALLISSDEYLKNTQDISIPVINIDEECVIAPPEHILSVPPADIAYIVYTSGSTGKPKGVKITQKNILNFSNGCEKLFCHGAVLSLCNIGFDAFMLESVAALLNNSTILLADETEHSDPSALAKLIKDFSVGFIALTPSRLEFYMNNKDFLSSMMRLESIVCGGEHFSSELLYKIKHHTNANIYNQYGPSETTVGVSYKLLNNSSLITIGSPMINCRLYILDKYLKPLPIGVYGDLYIGGVCVSAGYHNNQESTSQSFMDNPFEPGEKIYRSGDVGMWTKNGEIVLGGRKDAQIKLRGLRIELHEIASRIMMYPGVSGAAVKISNINSKDVISAYYTSETPISSSKILLFISSYLPKYMLPHIFMQIESIPLTENGKIDYASLPLPVMDNKSAIPENMIQKNLLDIFKSVLKRTDIGIDSDYFLYGGDSLNAAETIAEIEKEFRVFIKISDMYALKTVRLLSDKLSDAYTNEYNKTDIPGFIVKPAPDMEYYPLSSMQKSIYFQSQLDPTKVAYNMPGAFIINGAADIERLSAAFETLISKEELLRTGFVLRNDGVFQKIEASVPFTLHKLDSNTFEDAVNDFVKPFDPEHAPLLHAAIWKDSDDNTILFIDTHHIISDGISTPLFIKRLDSIYRTGDCPMPAFTYKDFSYNEDNCPKGLFKEQEEYWKNQVSNISESLDLPLDNVRAKKFDYKGDKISLSLSDEISGKCRDYCLKNNITPFIFFASVFSILLYKVSGTKDIITGTSVSGRRSKEEWDMMGIFIKTPPLRFRMDNDISFFKHLENVQRDVIALMDNQCVSAEKIIGYSGASRSLSQNPLYNTMFSMRPIDDKNFSFNGKPLKYIPINTYTSKLDLSVETFEDNKTFSFNFEYASSIFNRNTIELYMRSFEAIIKETIKNPSMSIKDIDPISASDRSFIMDNAFTKKLPYSDMRIDSMLDNIASVYPVYPAVIFHNETLNYGELKTLSDNLAANLISKGVSKGDRIGLCCNRTPYMLASLFGIIKAGCSYVPMLTSYPENRLAYMAENSQVHFILCDDETIKRLPSGLSCPLVKMDFTPNKYNPPDDLNISDEIHVLYTSGSTGQPKGVSLTHKTTSNLYSYIKDMFEPLKGNFLCTTNIVFDTFITESLLPLAMGKCVVLADEDEMMLPWKIGGLIEEHNIDFMQLTPSRLQLCLGNDAYSKAAANLKMMILVGEALGNALLKKLQSCGKLKIMNMYGPTEAAVYVTAADLTYADSVIIGKPMYNCRIYILDENLNHVMPTARGEIYIAGRCLASGYVNRQDLTDKVFVDDPMFPGEKMYKSGDTGRLLPDGNFVCIGRTDGQVKVNGQRIELDEISGTILKTGYASEAVTIVIKHDDGSSGLKSFIVLKDTSNDTSSENVMDDIKASLRKWLPEYMVPSYINPISAIPRTATGKTDLLQLANFSDSQTYKPKESHLSTEEELVKIWKGALNRSDISKTASFFDQGGTSLGALNILSKYFNKNLPMTIADFYDNPSIKDQLKLIADFSKSASYETPSHVPESSGEKPSGSSKALLITGATGFLGSHLVKESIEKGFNKIICIIRGDSHKRLWNSLEYYFGNKWVADNKSYITVHTGDIEKYNLGFSDIEKIFPQYGIKYILHSAAAVNHYGNAEASLKTNFKGTENMINLAKLLNARLIHISTASISGSHIVDAPDRNMDFSETDFDIGQNWQDNIYIKSKFLAEKLVRDEMLNGLDAKIFRVGRLVGRSTDGMFLPDPERNTFYNLVKGLSVLNTIPKELFSMPIEITSVDECSEAILSLLDEKYDTYHILNPKTVTLYDLIKNLHGTVYEIPSDQVEAVLFEKAKALSPESLAAILEFWNMLKYSRFYINVKSDITVTDLAKNGFIWKTPDISILLNKFM